LHAYYVDDHEENVSTDEIKAALKSTEQLQLQLELNSMILLKSGLDQHSRYNAT